MAKLNKSIVIQLKDVGIYDIITSFDTRHEHWSSGCPTCGSDDFDVMISELEIRHTSGTDTYNLFEERAWMDLDDDEVEEFKEEYVPTEAKLIQTVVNNTDKFPEMELKDFIEWLKEELLKKPRE